MKKMSVITLVLATFLLCGCSHYYYVANVQNVPILTEKNEFHLSRYIGFGDESSNFELQTAYSVSERIGIMANFQRAWGGRVSTNNYARGTFF